MEKVLFWLDEGFTHFGIAKFFKQNYEADLFGIVDVNPHLKSFFEKQNFVNFKKIWFFRDYVKNIKEKADIKYLSEFELKYNISIWHLAYTERYFLEYNSFYNFSKNEILKIFELECKLFEQILDECKPNYLLIRTTDLHRLQLLFELCKKKRVIPLMLIPTRLGYRMMISTDFDKIDEFKIQDFQNFRSKNNNSSTKNIRDKFMSDSSLFSQLTKSKIFQKESKFNLIKKNIHQLKILSNPSYQEIYDNYGKTPLNFLIKGDSGFTNIIKRRKRGLFLNKNCIYNWKQKFVYFPLHMEPERTVLISAPFYKNQLEVITNIAKSLPVDYDLLIKEHYSMRRLGWRPISYYKKILDLPNVKLIHPSIKPEHVLNDCSLVVTINGTSALEAAFYEKPAIVFSDTSFSYLPFIHRVKSYEELPIIIRKLLKSKFDYSLLEHYLNLVKVNSFEFNFTEFVRSIRRTLFSKNYYLRETTISNDDMKALLDNHHSEFNDLALQYISKIKKIKQLK